MRLGSSIMAHNSPLNAEVAPASRSGSTRRGSFSSSCRPSALASRLAGSMVTTATLAPSAAIPSAIAADVVVLPTPPDPPQTHTRLPASRSETLMGAQSRIRPCATKQLRYSPGAAMRILALYDIHGNPDALDAVLADPRAANPDAVVVGGDVVPGAFAVAALDRLDALSETLGGEVHWLRGNGEREVAAAVDGPPPAAGDNAAEMSAYSADELGPERARPLGDLPLTVTVDGVLFCHATPRSDEELVTRISAPERWSEVLAGVDAALVVAGHTHQQDDRMVDGVRFINAGSVGLPYEGDGDARWLWIEDGVPELRRTAYDAAAAGRRMRDACASLGDSVNASLIEPVEAMVVTRMFEERAGAG